MEGSEVEFLTETSIEPSVIPVKSVLLKVKLRADLSALNRHHRLSSTRGIFRKTSPSRINPNDIRETLFREKR